MATQPPRANEPNMLSFPGSLEPVAATKRTTANGQPVRKRAAEACRCCRQRKVRCDVVNCGIPCTNCRLDEQVCVIIKYKRRKADSGYSGGGDAVPTAATAHSLPRDNNTATGPHNDLDGMLDLDHTMPPALEFHSLTEDHEPHLLYQSHDQTPSLQTHDNIVDPFTSGFSVVESFHPPPEPMGNHEMLGLVDDPPSGQLPENRADYIPRFIKPPQARLADDDFDYMWKKRALAVPGTVLRNELLRSYIEHVHGYMPVLDLQDFIRIVDRGDGNTGKVSLLLFQCVMFAAAAFVDLHHLRDAGYPTRKMARRALFQKARLLYDLDYEIDSVSIIQSLLLMTFWYETPDDQKDLWYWMGVATAFSLRIGLHDELVTQEPDIKKRRLLKRIGWSCFMRDQIVALGVQRPTRINRQDHCIPMLTLDDFDLEAIPIGITCIDFDCIVARDSTYLKDLALMCIEKAKLCLCMSHIITTQYTVPFHDQGRLGPDGNAATTNLLLPKKDKSQSADVNICDVELREWYSNRPEEARYKASSESHLSNGDGAIMVHRAFLQMFYNTAVSALHRPQLLFPAEQESSHRKVQQAAWETTAVAEELTRLDIIRHVPSYGSTVILPAIMTHLVGIKSGDVGARKKSFEGFCICMAVMQRLRYMYRGPDAIAAILENAIRKLATSSSGNNQPGPGPADLTQFLERSAPQAHLAAGLKEPIQHEVIDDGEEYQPPYSSGLWDVANGVITGDANAQGKPWLDLASKSRSYLDYDYDLSGHSGGAIGMSSEQIPWEDPDLMNNTSSENAMDGFEVGQWTKASAPPQDDTLDNLLMEIEEFWSRFQ